MPLRRAQTALEYLLLLTGVLATVILVIVITQSALLGGSNRQLAGAGPQFFNILENVTRAYVPTPTPIPLGWLAASGSTYRLHSPAFSGLDAQASGSTYQLRDGLIALQPIGTSSGSTYQLKAGPAYTR